MNLNELFFFKVFRCVKDSQNQFKSNHKEDKCYFYHVSTTSEKGNQTYFEKDRRREPVSFNDFFKFLHNKIIEDKNLFLSKERTFEFKKGFPLNYYADLLPFQSYNKCKEDNCCDTDYCKNETEYFYHINRYNTNICRYFNILGKCKKKFCYNKHIKSLNSKDKNNSDEISKINKINDNSNNDEGIKYFQNEVNKWLERKEVQLKEILILYNKILSYHNKYLEEFQINETKKYFVFFQKLLNDSLNNTNDFNYSQQNNNNLNFNIIQNNGNNYTNDINEILYKINNQFNPQNKLCQIYKNGDLFKSLNIFTNVCFISNSSSIKLGEVVTCVYAMLNSSNGVIIYGGNEIDKTINGICLKRKDREAFKKWFNTEFAKILIKYEDYITYKFYDLANNYNDECILIITVKKIKPHHLLTTFSSQKCFIINQNILNNKKEKNICINKKDIIELNTKEYIGLLRERLLIYYSKKFGINKNN